MSERMEDEALDIWLIEQINLADNGRHESHGRAPNSYGAGYDQGRYDGLREALGKLMELWGDPSAAKREVTL